MEKYSVDIEKNKTKHGSQGDCPSCGSEMNQATNPPKCPKCGTEPFESGLEKQDPNG